MNLLDYFALHHIQVARINLELLKVHQPDEAYNAKVELNLTPRDMKQLTDNGQVMYQVTGRLNCQGTTLGGEKDEPLFSAEIGLEAVYRQARGSLVPFEQFVKHHTSLARQLYPLIYQQLLPMLQSLGLTHVRLPLDLLQDESDTSSENDRKLH